MLLRRKRTTVRVEYVNEGMARREVAPLKCSECGAEFAETQGGICRSCGRVLRRGRVRPLDLITDIVAPDPGWTRTISRWRKKLTTGSVGSQIRARGDLTYRAHLFVAIVTSVVLSLVLLDKLGFVSYDWMVMFTFIGIAVFIPFVIAAFLAIVLGVVFSLITPRDWRLGVLSAVLSMVLVLFVNGILEAEWVGPNIVVMIISGGVVYVALCIPFSIRWFLFVRKGLVPDEPPEERKVPIGELPTI